MNQLAVIATIFPPLRWLSGFFVQDFGWEMRRKAKATDEGLRKVMAQRYVAPDWFTRNVFNRIVAPMTRLGISVWGSRVLEVRGRKTGELRRTPVNLLMLEGTRYLVAARGHTHWVRNMRAAGEGLLVLGRRRERFVGSELLDSDKEPILRAYLKRWKWEVGQFFGGVDADSTTEEVRRIAPDHPIFRVETPPREPARTTAGQS